MDLTTKGQHQWIANLRALATIAVIMLHISSPVANNFGVIPIGSWWAGNFYDSLCRFCVPVFLLITGTLLLQKSYTLKEFFMKRFLRVILPFAFWSLIYVAYTLLLRHLNNADLDLKSNLKYVFSLLKDGNQTSFHLWYIYMLLGLYLVIPILAKWTQTSSSIDLKYFLTLWGLSILFTLPYLEKLKPNLDLTYFSGYVGYLVLGYYLSSLNYLHPTKAKQIAVALIAVGFLSTFFGSYLVTLLSGKFSEVLYLYLAPNVIVFSIGIFLLFRYQTFESKVLLRIISFISEYSFGIYLVHILVLNTIGLWGWNWKFTHPAVSIPFVTVICSVLSTGIIYFLRKMPYGRYLAG